MSMDNEVTLGNSNGIMQCTIQSNKWSIKKRQESSRHTKEKDGHSNVFDVKELSFKAKWWVTLGDTNEIMLRRM